MKKTCVLSTNISVRTLKTIFILITVICSCTFSGCYFFPQEEEVLAPPLKTPEQIVYKTIEVKRGDIEKRINATAYFVSDSQRDVAFKQRGGRIESINVKIGDLVEAGDVLIQLETDNLETQLTQQEISLEKLKLNYQQSLSNAERTIKLAELQLEEFNRKLEKLEETVKNIPKDVSVHDIVPGADAEMMSLKGQIERQKINIEGEWDKYKGTKEIMELDIKTAETQIENLKDEIEKTRIVSPLPGRVVWISSSKVGDYIYAHSNLVRIADITRLRLRYTGENISDFRMGDGVEVKINSDQYEGEVVMIPSTAPLDIDESLRKSVLIEVKHLPKGVGLGDSARISLLLNRKENVIVIPRDLLHSFMGEKTVHILEDGLKKDRNVQVGIETPTEVEIINGLEEGEYLIVY